jgi:alpha-mannosidase
MHKWVDLSDNSFGLSILNDCKYGCDVKDGHIRPTLFRCATNPNTIQDREYHSFTFSIYPHEYAAKDSSVVEEAYNVNFPLYAVPVKAQKGTMDNSYSLVFALDDNIVIETVKIAEDSDELVVRAYETWNAKTPTSIFFCDEIESVSECNLLEEEDEAIAFSGRGFDTTFKPFEIKTFKIKFKK